jgi:hypothetical protein
VSAADPPEATGVAGRAGDPCGESAWAGPAVLGRARDWLGATSRRVWLVTFVVVALAGSCWSLSLPLYAGPDEPAHMLRSVSLVRGQIIGDDIGVVDNNARKVTVPGVYSVGNPACFAFEPEIPAGCQTWEFPDADVDILTTAALHPPAFYAWVGLPTLVSETRLSVYAMRLMGVALFAAIIASAAVTLSGLRRGRLAAVGLVVALTPMVLFVSGLVNPSSAEIAGAIGTWVGGFVLLRHAGLYAVVDRRVVARTAAAASVLMLSRSLSPLWVVSIAVVLLIAAPSGAVGVLWRSTAARVGAAVVAASGVAAAAWIVLAQPLSQVDTLRSFDLDPMDRFLFALGASGRAPADMVGRLGWLDVPVPPVTLFVWYAMVGAVVAIGFAMANRRQALAMVAVVAGTMVTPVIMDYMQAPRTGYIWQARYTIPVAVGIPLLAAMSAAASRRSAVFDRTRLFALVGVAFIVGQVLAFHKVLFRYAVGLDGDLDVLFRTTQWAPPFGQLTWLVAYAVVMVVAGWWLVNLATTRSGTTDA